jgi:predicted RNA-binding Zn ribbon-like protein
MNHAIETLPPPLLVGEHLALDFLNSIATPVDLPVDWLQSGPHFLDWLEQAGVFESRAIAEYQKAHSTRTLDKTAARARDFREWLRVEVRERLGASSINMTAREIRPLNDLLAEARSWKQIDLGPPLMMTTRRPTDDAGQLLQPLAEAAADLLCNQDFTLIRACGGAGCTLMFLDTTKSHRRRWCSMALCGNRAKVAAFRDRSRD